MVFMSQLLLIVINSLEVFGDLQSIVLKRRQQPDYNGKIDEEEVSLLSLFSEKHSWQQELNMGFKQDYQFSLKNKTKISQILSNKYRGCSRKACQEPFCFLIIPLSGQSSMTSCPKAGIKTLATPVLFEVLFYPRFLAQYIFRVFLITE